MSPVSVFPCSHSSHDTGPGAGKFYHRPVFICYRNNAGAWCLVPPSPRLCWNIGQVATVALRSINQPSSCCFYATNMLCLCLVSSVLRGNGVVPAHVSFIGQMSDMRTQHNQRSGQLTTAAQQQHNRSEVWLKAHNSNSTTAAQQIRPPASTPGT